MKYDAATPDATPANPLAQTAFTYDAVGNRTVVAQTTGTSAPVNTNYTANTLNQYTVVGSGTATYDANGNLATTASGTYAYDAQNRLTTIASGTNTVSLAYDGLNRAVTRTVNGSATHLIYDRDWNIIEEYDGSGVQLAAMAYGAATDEPIFRWASGYILSYYHQDAIGNVTTLTDTSGIPVESYRYDIYGQPTIYDPYLNVRTTSFFGNPYMFTGREYLAEAGVYQYRNRAYSPELGRFSQTDPIGFAAGDPNIMRYVGNDPANAKDPLGLMTWWNSWVPGQANFEYAETAFRNGDYVQSAGYFSVGLVEQMAFVATLGYGTGLNQVGQRSMTFCQTAFSRLAPGGGLMAHENFGGHLLASHVGKTEAQLLSRALSDPATRGVASSFFDRMAAEAAASQAIEANAAKISLWLAAGGGRLAIEGAASSAVGRVTTSAGASTISSTSRFILVKSAASPTGYRILTGYPF